jgi:hypothetical protein
MNGLYRFILVRLPIDQFNKGRGKCLVTDNRARRHRRQISREGTAQSTQQEIPLEYRHSFNISNFDVPEKVSENGGIESAGAQRW